MLRIIMRVLAALFLIGSLGLGGFFTYILFTPSDEEMTYEQKHKEAMQKIKKAGAAQGTPCAETLPRGSSPFGRRSPARLLVV